MSELEIKTSGDIHEEVFWASEKGGVNYSKVTAKHWVSLESLKALLAEQRKKLKEFPMPVTAEEMIEILEKKLVLLEEKIK